YAAEERCRFAKAARPRCSLPRGFELARGQRRSRASSMESLGPVDQVGNPIPDRSCNKQSRQRLFRRISRDRSACASALLIYSGGGSARLVADVASGTLDCIHRLSPGGRRFVSQVSGLVHGCPGGLMQISKRGFGLIDLVLSHLFRLGGELA